MIGLLIQDNAYEQDIRELLMSFYPGETYAHEIKDGVDFYVQTRLIQKEEDGCAASEEDADGQEWNVGIALWEQIREREPQAAVLIFQCRKDWRAFILLHLPEDIRIFPITARRKMW